MACAHQASAPQGPLTDLISRSKPLHAYIVQVIIVANHMNGKDTHVRGLHVYGPIECVSFQLSRLPA